MRSRAILWEGPAMASVIELTLNGRKRIDAVPGNRLLLDYLRETVGLTGTKTGCDGGECGACTVLVDDKPTLSCLTLAGTVAASGSTRSKSLGKGGALSAVQRGFHEKLGSQCGYCTPGFIMASAGLLRRNPRPSEDEIRRSARQQHLPLHGLREDHRGRAACVRPAGDARGGEPMSAICHPGRSATARAEPGPRGRKHAHVE